MKPFVKHLPDWKCIQFCQLRVYVLPMQSDSIDPLIAAQLNSSQQATVATLTHGYFSFAGNLLTGSLPGFLSSSQVPLISQGLINLQVCSLAP